MTRPLFDVFRNAMLKKPDGSRKEAQDTFLAEMKANPAYFDLLAMDYFDRMAAVWTVKKEKIGNSFGRTDVSADKIERTRAALVSRAGAVSGSVEVPTQKDRAKAREAARERAGRAFENLKESVRNVILLDLVMPNGKLLRHATGAECKKAGGFYAEIGKRLKGSQVVDRHLSEADLQKLRSQHFKSKERHEHADALLAAAGGEGQQ